MMNPVLLSDNEPSQGEGPTHFNVTKLENYDAIRERLEILFQDGIPSAMIAEELAESPTIGDVVNQEIGSDKLGNNSDFMKRISQRYMQKMTEQAQL